MLRPRGSPFATPGCSPFAAALLLTAAGLLAAPGLRAEPRWVRCSPTADPAHAMFISWNSDGDAESMVQYGPDAGYGAEASGSAEQVGDELGVVHTVELTGLEPDTVYHYRVGGPTAGWSDDHSFVTAPADVCTPFSFGVAADNRGNFSGTSLCWATVLEAIAAQGVDLVINSGDLVHEGKNAGEWADFLETTAPWMGEIAIVPALGNHDDDEVDGDGALYNQIFALPRNAATGTEDFYSFDYGNVHFVCLSTHSYDIATQTAWLEQDLEASDRMWKVVFFHVPVYSSGSHGSNEDGESWPYVPIFDAHHVDLVINGHDHIYERYNPMAGHQEVASYDEGTCYIVSGGGGAATDPLYWFREKEDGLAVGDPLHHYVHITVSNNVMHVRAERVSGTGCLQGGQGVIDEFDIVKTLADDPCAGPTDADGDGFSPPADCDDGDASVHPGAEEICGDGIDQNCDGSDLACPCADADGDGFADAACGGDDCDDGDPAVKPGAIEQCGNGVDDDCDGETDEADCQSCSDADGDEHPAIDPACPAGDDCDDGDPLVYPGAPERCNGIDDDCDGDIDEDAGCAGCRDSDADGHDAIGAGCPTGDDCDDGEPEVHPGAQETCNGRDDDCDGATDEELGELSCGQGECAAVVPACVDGQPQQCQPGQPPEPSEVSCADGMDNDCDGLADGQDADCSGAGTTSGCGCATGPPAARWPWPLLLGLACLLGRRRRMK